MRRELLTTLCCLTAVLTSLSLAQAQEAGGRRQAGKTDLLTLATYPVGDIVFQVTDYPQNASPRGLRSKIPLAPSGGRGGFGGGGGGGMGGGGAFSIPDPGVGASLHQETPFRFSQYGRGKAAPEGPSMAITIDALVRTITNCIAPDTWSANGMGQAEVSILGDMLVVSQKPEVHRQISQFLEMVRRDAGKKRTVTVDARWLLLNSDELDQLLMKSEKPGPPIVNPEALAALSRRPTSLRAITNCFSGQLVHVVSGTEKSIVSSWIPVVGSVDWSRSENAVATTERPPIRFVSDAYPVRGSSVGYQPVLTNVNLGVVLEIRPIVVQGEKAAIVDLASTLTFRGEEPSSPARAGGGVAPPVDTVLLETARLATTLRVPLSKPVLVGGLSYSPAAAMASASTAGDAKQGSREARQAYLILSVR